VDGFRPHVTLAYSNSESNGRQEIERAVQAVSGSTARFEVTMLSLAPLNRDNDRYEWTEVVSLPVGT
jgi:2'-5' RNA ligase